MLSMDINHKDIISFITAKDDLTKVTGANISVKVDDKFMQNLDSNQKLWNKIIHQAHKSAEPKLWDLMW